jgi:hypothetical protein
MVTHRTPIRERWGGYYVTGDTGSQRHRGHPGNVPSSINKQLASLSKVVMQVASCTLSYCTLHDSPQENQRV